MPNERFPFFLQIEKKIYGKLATKCLSNWAKPSICEVRLMHTCAQLLNHKRRKFSLIFVIVIIIIVAGADCPTRMTFIMLEEYLFIYLDTSSINREMSRKCFWLQKWVRAHVYQCTIYLKIYLFICVTCTGHMLHSHNVAIFSVLLFIIISFNYFCSTAIMFQLEAYIKSYKLKLRRFECFNAAQTSMHW